MTGSGRRERHRILFEALKAGKIHSQRDVVKVLAKVGITVTQATASRDLDDLGAVRGKDASGKLQYLVPDNGLGMIDDLTLGIFESERMVVIKTPPGAAQLIAGRIDKSSVKGVVGTLAGDDTIFVACDRKVSLRTVREQLTAIVDGQKSKRGNSLGNGPRSKASR
jgi:transcriptional regulator of arginine metabolism